MSFLKLNLNESPDDLLKQSSYSDPHDIQSKYKVLQHTDNFSKFQLKSNGLKVVIVPRPSSTKTVHAQIVYGVGSYNESVGVTGGTHVLEHLLFRNPFNRETKEESPNIFDDLEKYGATINATTSFDRTAFVSTIPSRVLGLWAKHESKRCAKVPFYEERDAGEKKVVLDELRISEDNPFARLTAEMLETVYSRSGYNHETGGFLRDVASVSYDALEEFHTQFYGPNNATVAITGVSNTQKVLEAIESNFSSIPRREVPKVQRMEEKQLGPKQLSIYWDKPIAMMSIGFRNMEAAHSDSVVLSLVAELLGYSNIGPLWVLKQSHRVPQFSVMNNRLKRRHLFQIVMMLSDLGSSLQLVPAYIFSALKQYSTKLVSASDLNVVKQSLLNKWKNARVGNEALGNQVTEAISNGAGVEDVWRRENHLMSITPEDILRVCKYTFQSQRSVTGLLFKPKEETIARPLVSAQNYKDKLFTASNSSLNMAEVLENLSRKYASYTEKGSNLFSNSDIKQYQCSFGVMQLVSVPHAEKMYFNITMKNPENIDSASSKVATMLVSEGLPKTFLKSNDDFTNFIFPKKDELSKLFSTYMTEKGLEIQIQATPQKLHLSLGMNTDVNISKVFSKVAAAIKSINYTEDGVRMKTMMAAGMAKGSEFSAALSVQMQITNHLFAPCDINYIKSPEHEIATYEAVTLPKVNAFKDQLFKGEHALAVSVIAPRQKTFNEQTIGEAILRFHKALGGQVLDHQSMSLLLPLEEHPSKNKDYNAVAKTINVGKVTDGVGGLGVRINLSKNDLDYTAVRIATDVLGAGMNSLLMDRLRKKMNLTYGAYSRLKGGNSGSSSYIHMFATFNMKDMDEGMRVMEEIFRGFRERGVTKEEFETKRSHFVNSLNVLCDNNVNLLNLTHNQLMNGCKISMDDIKKRAWALTLDDVNLAIKKYILPAAIVHVKAGDYNSN